MVLKNELVPRMWISRDMSGGGLYTIWVDHHPVLDNCGYWKVSEDKKCVGALLMTIHPSKFPWESLALDRGECKSFVIVAMAGEVRSEASQASMGLKGTENVAI